MMIASRPAFGLASGTVEGREAGLDAPDAEHAPLRVVDRGAERARDIRHRPRSDEPIQVGKGEGTHGEPPSNSSAQAARTRTFRLVSSKRFAKTRRSHPDKGESRLASALGMAWTVLTRT